MISKITSDNGASFYKPAFDLINAAVAEQKVKRADAGAAELNIPEIKSVEDYFNNLTAIRELWVNIALGESGQFISGNQGGYLLLMPADEDIFHINANTREITVPASVKKNGIGVLGDHFAEMIVLRIDRYFDNQDLLKTNCAINWTFTPQGSRQASSTQGAEAAFVPNADLAPGYVTFGFIITKAMTAVRGTLNFSVTFYDETNDIISYSFNTLTASVAINDTLTLKDPAVVNNDVNNFLGRLSNSVYNDTALSPVSTPVWYTGIQDSDTQAFLGLPDKAYLPDNSDRANNYTPGNGTILRAYAGCEPSTADVYYRWVFTPAELYNNGATVKMGLVETTDNFKVSYVAVGFEDMVDSLKYYISEDEGRTVLVAEKPYGDQTVDEPITLKVQYTKAEALALKAQVEAQDGLAMPSFYTVGSAKEALSAGRYQVFAQGHLGTGAYVPLAEGEQPLAGINYYIATDMDENSEIDVNTEIDVMHPIRNQEAFDAKEAGQQLYVFVGGTSNSHEIESNRCEVPAAIKPNVELKVTSSFDFDQNSNVSYDENSEYVYIEDVVLPNLLVNVTIPSENALDRAGQFAAQLIEVDTPPVTLWASDDENIVTMSSLINDGLVFNDLSFNDQNIGQIVSTGNVEEAAQSGKFYVSSVDEGEYAVRVFNRRNGTYAIADSTSSLKTSYVAPEVNTITVKAVRAGTGSNVSLLEEPIVVLDDGQRPNDTLVDLELNRRQTKFVFEMVDNTVITKRDLNKLAIKYEIEEVEYDPEEGTITSRIPEVAYESSEYQEDIREIQATENDQGQMIYSFEIDNDPGYYRIKTTSMYNGTTRISYTDIFGVNTH